MTRNRSDEEVGQNKAPIKEFAGVAPGINGDIVIGSQADASSRDQKEKISGIEITKPKFGFAGRTQFPEERFATLPLLR